MDIARVLTGTLGNEMGMSGFRVVIGSVKPRKKAAVARKKLETAAADTNTMLNEFQAQIMPPLTKVSEIRQRDNWVKNQGCTQIRTKY
jgi:hypothetical protein